MLDHGQGVIFLAADERLVLLKAHPDFQGFRGTHRLSEEHLLQYWHYKKMNNKDGGEAFGICLGGIEKWDKVVSQTTGQMATNAVSTCSPLPSRCLQCVPCNAMLNHVISFLFSPCR